MKQELSSHVQKIVNMFINSIWQDAFGETGKDLRKGEMSMNAIVPEIRAFLQQISDNQAVDQNIFLKKLFELQISYAKKANIRLQCHKVMRLPYLIDSLILNSLQNFYQNNIHFYNDQLSNYDRKSNRNLEIWNANTHGLEAGSDRLAVSEVMSPTRGTIPRNF